MRKRVVAALILMVGLGVAGPIQAEVASDQINVNLTVGAGDSGSGSSGSSFGESDGTIPVSGGGGGSGDDGVPPDDGPPPGGSPPDIESIIAGLRDFDPFLLLPESELLPGSLGQFDLSNFLFIQSGEPTRTINESRLVRINGRKYLTVAIAYDAVPAVLKTIGVTIFNLEFPQRSFSFILKADAASRVYSATLAPLGRDGFYPFNVHLLDYANHRARTLSGLIQVVRSGPSVASRLEEIIAGLGAAETSAVSAALLGVSSAALVAGGAQTAVDLYLLLLRLAGALPEILGFRRKIKPWGVIYDSVTKRPLDPAYVSVQRDGREVTSAITDIEGRYSLFLPPGRYELVAHKSHYRFPSEVLRGRREDELYAYLYFGGPIEVSGEEVTALNIPLDPIGFDWNEYVKNKIGYTRSYRDRIWRERVLGVVFGAGFFLAVGTLVFAPSWLSVTVLGLYLLFFFGRRFGVAPRGVTIKRQSTGEPLAYAIVRFFVTGLDQEVGSKVTDELGRFYVLLRPGEYYLTVEEKAPDGAYRRIYRSSALILRRGVLENDIVIPDL